MGINYRDAGVDVEAGYEAVRQMKQYVAKTHTHNVIGGLGGFGGLFSGYKGHGAAGFVAGDGWNQTENCLFIESS